MFEEDSELVSGSNDLLVILCIIILKSKKIRSYMAKINQVIHAMASKLRTYENYFNWITPLILNRLQLKVTEP
jgi:hypothetical protein